MAQLVKNPPAMQETPGRFLGWEDPLEKGTATRSSILAWRIPWTEESEGLQSVGGLHASGEGERVIALESWEGNLALRRVEEGLSRSFSG